VGVVGWVGERKSERQSEKEGERGRRGGRSSSIHAACVYAVREGQRCSSGEETQHYQFSRRKQRRRP
jgi:hypothetical protein